MQALYQIFWMLLILFAAPKVFDRYNIRDKCEVFADEQEPFCTSPDLNDLGLADPQAACALTFPVGPDGCPEFKEPTLESITAATSCVGDACQPLLDNANKVRTR